jgi:hypothetical protein
MQKLPLSVDKRAFVSGPRASQWRTADGQLAQRLGISVAVAGAGLWPSRSRRSASRATIEARLVTPSLPKIRRRCVETVQRLISRALAMLLLGYPPATRSAISSSRGLSNVRGGRGGRRTRTQRTPPTSMSSITPAPAPAPRGACASLSRRRSRLSSIASTSSATAGTSWQRPQSPSRAPGCPGRERGPAGRFIAGIVHPIVLQETQVMA